MDIEKSRECEEVQSFLLENDDIDDGSLGAARLGHIEACGECRTLLCEMRRIRKVTAESGVVPERDGVMLHDFIAERIRNGDTETPLLASRKPRLRIPFVGVAAAAVVAVFLLRGVPFTSFIDKSMDNAEMKDEIAYTESALDEEADSGEPRLFMSAAGQTEEDTAECETAEEYDEAGVADDADANAEITTADSPEARAEIRSETKSETKSTVTSGSSYAQNPETSADRTAVTAAPPTPIIKNEAAKENGGAERIASDENLSVPSEESADDVSSGYTMKKAPPVMMLAPQAEEENSENVSVGEASAYDDSASEESEADTAASTEVPASNEFDDITPMPNGMLVASTGSGEPITCESIIEEAKEYFESNGCPHTDGRHDITLQMAESVDFSAFCDWYIGISDMETEYTVENFDRCFFMTEE